MKAKEAANFLLGKTKERPLVAVVLGSGLGAFAEGLEKQATIHFEEIPHFHKPTVAGHGGKLVFARISDVPVLVQQGRVHYFEGHTMESVAHPSRTLGLFGIKTVVLTNASGGLQTDMEPGDFMVLNDHINLTGTNPLIGPNLEQFGPRFPDMTEAYDKSIREKIKQTFGECEIPHREGVYVGLSGPTYETPAEIKYLQRIGGDAVGMSTVPETIVLRHMGVRVGAISCITNKAAGLSGQPLDHAEVTETGKRIEHTFSKLLKTLLPKL